MVNNDFETEFGIRIPMAISLCTSLEVEIEIQS
jgi:hypothetical protein